MREGRSLETLIEAGRAAEQSGELERALELLEEAYASLASAPDPRRAAELLRRIGHVQRKRGDTELAREKYEASLAIAEASDLTREIAYTLNALAVVEQFSGGFDAAEPLYVRARALAEEVADPRLAVMIDQNLGTLANVRGDVETAIRCYRRALERFRALGDETGAAWVLNNLGMAHVDVERWAEAEACFEEAYGLADRLQDPGTLGSVELNRSELYLKRQRYEQVRECCDHAFEIFTRLGAKARIGEACKFYGVLYRETTKPALAASHLQRGLELAREAEDRLLEGEVESEWAILDSEHGRNREALGRLNRAHQIFTKLRARRELADIDQRLDRLEGTFLRVVRAWAESIESKDRYTAGHCERVADYACRLAEAVGLAGRDLVWFRMGALLHDVGKTVVPAEILNKPGRLTAEEWTIMQRHTEAGDAIVADLAFPWDIRPIVRNHHERWDGSGYPDGLRGEEIPLTARILCVADVYDALTSTRSYRAALSHEEAIEIMASDAGRILDPALFLAFQALPVEAPAEM